MDYTRLKIGDKLPAVGVLQKLLNRYGAKLNTDGIFGRRTWDAVLGFQRKYNLVIDGDVGVETWTELVTYTNNTKIVDCIDVFDLNKWKDGNGKMMTGERRVIDITNVGGNPISIGGMSNGVEQAVTLILLNSTMGQTFLLRFFGHGAPGSVGISVGEWVFQDPSGKNPDTEITPEEYKYSSINYDNTQNNLDIMLPKLRRLRAIFSPYGCIEFMHCSVAGSSKGKQFCNKIANTVGVPVTAGINTQYSGGLSTFKFEGPTYTAIPNGGTLKGWCRNLPDFPPICK
jgi:peptidoglycan hydrolase-like protein with peptidoglycan-binding domain